MLMVLGLLITLHTMH